MWRKILTVFISTMTRPSLKEYAFLLQGRNGAPGPEGKPGEPGLPVSLMVNCTFFLNVRKQTSKRLSGERGD